MADDALLRDYQRRTRELEALFETAGDLSALRDVDQVLAAICRRGRQLLGSDVAYLMLNDEERRETYMRVGDGIQTPEFLRIRLAYGEGLGGLVAKTGMPQWSSHYYTDENLAPSIAQVVRNEALVAILGVPLTVGDRVIGVLFAADRRERDFSHAEVALLSSLASHAAIALENASLFEANRAALAKWKEASGRIEQHNRMLERAAELHERLTELVLAGAPVPSLTDTVAEAIGGHVVVLDAKGMPLTPAADLPELARDVLERAANSGGSLEMTDADGATVRLAPAQAGARRLGFLLHRGEPLSGTDVRALERAAMVTALLLLDRRTHDEARIRAMADLVTELVSQADIRPDRLRRRADAAGLSLPEPPYIALVALASAGGDGDRRLEAAARLALSDTGLARIEGLAASLVVHGTDPAATARDLAVRLTEDHGEPVTVGAVGPEETLGQAAARLGRADMCAKVLETTGQRGRGATPEQLGVYALLFSDVGRERIDEFVAETLGPVLDHDAERGSRLLATLEAYFDVGGQTGRLAGTLYVHVNTLYQRLERIDRLLGEDWRRGEQSLQVHLALRLARLIRKGV